MICVVEMFNKLMNLSTSEYDTASTGSIITRFSYDIEQVAESVSNSLTALIQDSLRIVALSAYLVWLSWQLIIGVVINCSSDFLDSGQGSEPVSTYQPSDPKFHGRGFSRGTGSH